MRFLRDIPKASWVLSLLSAVLQALIFPNASISWLSWIALAPLIVVLVRVKKPGHGFVLAYVNGVVWYLTSCFWVFHVMHVYGGLSTVLAAIMLFLFAAYLGLHHAVFGWLLSRIALHPKSGIAGALIVAPFLWVAVELARAHIVSFPWDLLGYSQVDDIGLARIVTITGVYGLSFIIMVVNAGFACAWVKSKNRGLIFVATLIAATALQCLHWAGPPMPEGANDAVLIQPNLPMNESTWSQEDFDHKIAEFVRDGGRLPASSSTSSGTPAGTRIIMWPESPAPFYENDPKLLAPVMTIAGKQNAFVVLGVYGLESPKQPGSSYDVYNSALVVAPNGTRIGRYDKIHLVPFGEYVPFKPLFFFLDSVVHDVGGFSRGTKRKVFALDPSAVVPMPDMPGMNHTVTQPNLGQNSKENPHKAGIFICYEAVFPIEVREFVNNGAEVLLNISNDGWYGPHGAPRQDLNMARMRAIENHRWLLRATNTGISTSIDPYGRIRANTELDVQAALVAKFSFETETTFYTRYGDIFAYLCAIISIAVMLMTWSIRKEIE